MSNSLSGTQFKEASLGRRLWALFLDSSASWLLALFLEPHDMSKRLILQMGILFIEISVLTSLRGASFGQSAARLKVIDVNDGSALPIPRIEDPSNINPSVNTASSKDSTGTLK